MPGLEVGGVCKHGAGMHNFFTLVSTLITRISEYYEPAKLYRKNIESK